MQVNTSVSLKDYSKEFLKATEEKKRLILEAIGSECENAAKDLCPVDTGRLRNSITYATATYGGEANYTDNIGNEFSDGAAKSTPKKSEVYIGTNVEYAPAVEFRDSVHKLGQAHFLRDGVVTSEDKIKKIVKAGLQA